MAEHLHDLEVETVDVYGFELCSKAHGIDLNTLLNFVSDYRYSKETLLLCLRIALAPYFASSIQTQTFLLSNHQIEQMDTAIEKIRSLKLNQNAEKLQQASMETTIEKIRSLKLNQNAEKLHHLMSKMPHWGIGRFALVFKADLSKVFEMALRYETAMGSRLERLKRRQEAFLENRDFTEDFDIKQIEEEWDQIYILFNEIVSVKPKEDAVDSKKGGKQSKVVSNKHTFNEDVDTKKGGKHSHVVGNRQVYNEEVDTKKGGKRSKVVNDRQVVDTKKGRKRSKVVNNSQVVDTKKGRRRGNVVSNRQVYYSYIKLVLCIATPIAIAAIWMSHI